MPKPRQTSIFRGTLAASSASTAAMLVMSSTGVPSPSSSPRIRLSVPPSTRTIVSDFKFVHQRAVRLGDALRAGAVERVDRHFPAALAEPLRQVLLREVILAPLGVGRHRDEVGRQVPAGGVGREVGEGQVAQEHLPAGRAEVEVQRQPAEHVEPAAGAGDQHVPRGLQFGEEGESEGVHGGDFTRSRCVLQVGQGRAS